MVACLCLPRHPDHLWVDFVLVDVRAVLISPGRWSCDFPALFRIDVVFVDVNVVPFSPSRWPCDFPPLFNHWHSGQSRPHPRSRTWKEKKKPRKMTMSAWLLLALTASAIPNALAFSALCPTGCRLMPVQLRSHTSHVPAAGSVSSSLHYPVSLGGSTLCANARRRAVVLMRMRACVCARLSST